MPSAFLAVYNDDNTPSVSQELLYNTQCRLVQRVGFFGILAAASIPNPLFDLAGITCGHFLVPFWTFFGATLIGKAVIKMHIQKVFIIFLFSKHHVAWLLEIIKVKDLLKLKE